MSSFVVSEALYPGLKEGFKAGVIWLILTVYFYRIEKAGLIRSFYWAFAAAFLVAPFLVANYSTPQAKAVIGNLISSSFALLLVLSAITLYHAFEATPLVDRNNPIQEMIKRLMGHAKFQHTAVFFLTVIFFLPDLLGSGIFIRETSVLKEGIFGTYGSAAFGFITGCLFWLIIYKAIRPFWIGGFFDIPQFLLFLSMVKLLGSGAAGLSEVSLLPSVQRGFMKFSHDFIHQSFVFLMVPDHQLLRTTTWNFIGFFFGPNFAEVVSLGGILLLPALFLYYRLLKPLPEPAAETGAGKRKLKSIILHSRRRKALPVVLFIGLVLVTWFSGRGEPVSRLSIPRPKPVVEDKGAVLIPINDPTMDLKDGRLHKFSLRHEGNEIRMLVIRKPGGGISVCLDACEICPPDGYGQRDEYVVCIYCNTPIPVDTLGQAGGCNPIPLSFTEDDRFIRVEMKELFEKQQFIKAGNDMETGK